MLVLQACESGLTFLLPCSCPGKADLEAAVAKPKEDGCCGCHLLCLGGACVEKASATSGLLIKKPLTMGGLLAFVGGTLIEEVTIGLLAVVSSTFVEEALVGHGLMAIVFVLPQFVHGLFPVPDGGVPNPVKNPVGSAWRRLHPFVLQPSRRIRGVGQGQMSRRASTVPPLGRVREGSQFIYTSSDIGMYVGTEK
jgi:hypothetical protein